ncbi:hypothetical protein K0M31_008433 [Melipona bicolor]|uniref:Uncharacterized protein n=1 Tax=Melipona bicolor TaxID=60889 RepID=A0AA40FRA7_9HYME|nr:hypothetical protein K0M31_008433 [Melipona bicolor]
MEEAGKVEQNGRPAFEAFNNAPRRLKKKTDPLHAGGSLLLNTIWITLEAGAGASAAGA